MALPPKNQKAPDNPIISSNVGKIRVIVNARDRQVVAVIVEAIDFVLVENNSPTKAQGKVASPKL